MILKIRLILLVGITTKHIDNWEYQLQMLEHFIWLITKAGEAIKEVATEPNLGYCQWLIKFKDKQIGIKFNIKDARKN